MNIVDTPNRQSGNRYYGARHLLIARPVEKCEHIIGLSQIWALLFMCNLVKWENDITLIYAYYLCDLWTQCEDHISGIRRTFYAISLTFGKVRANI